MISSFTNKSYDSIDASKLRELIPNINLIDIREPYEVQRGSIKGALNIPMGLLLQNPEKYLRKERTYYIICHSGSRSSRTCSRLAKAGYKVVNVSGGYMKYKRPV